MLKMFVGTATATKKTHRTSFGRAPYRAPRRARLLIIRTASTSVHVGRYYFIKPPWFDVTGPMVTLRTPMLCG